MAKKLTHEEFMEKFHEKSIHATDIEVLGKYNGTHTKIKCKCRICNHEWTPTPNTLLRGHGCPECKKKTHEQFMKDFYEKNIHAKDIEILGTYTNKRTKIKVRCKIDNYEWEVLPNNLLKNYNCPQCSINAKRKTHEQFMKDFHKKNTHANDIEILEEYRTSDTLIKCKCKIDGHVWQTTPNHLLQGYGCSKCGGTNKKSHEDFIKEMEIKNPNIEILGQYINSKTYILCKCKIDGYKWETIPNSLLLGCGCPKCNVSKGEKRIAQYLDNMNINYIYNEGYFKDLISISNKPLRIDFILEKEKIWIEYDGEQHFYPVTFGCDKEEAIEKFKKQQYHDELKNQYAKEHNWIMIRIPYWDFDNIEEILNKELNRNNNEVA